MSVLSLPQPGEPTRYLDSTLEFTCGPLSAQFALTVLHNWEAVKDRYHYAVTRLMGVDASADSPISQVLTNGARRREVQKIGRLLSRYRDDREIFMRFYDLIEVASGPKNKIATTRDIPYDDVYMKEIGLFYDSILGCFSEFEDYFSRGGDPYRISNDFKRQRYVAMIQFVGVRNVWYIDPQQEEMYSNLANEGHREPDGRIWSRRGDSRYFRGE